MLLYFDTSAIVKLMRDEAETAALHRFMNSEPNIYFTCDLSRTEIARRDSSAAGPRNCGRDRGDL